MEKIFNGNLPFEISGFCKQLGLQESATVVGDIVKWNDILQSRKSPS